MDGVFVVLGGDVFDGGIEDVVEGGVVVFVGYCVEVGEVVVDYVQCVRVHGEV